MPKYLEFHHEGTSRDQVYQAYRNEMDPRLKERYHAILLGHGRTELSGDCPDPVPR